MAAPAVTVALTNGGIGRQAAGTDYYSGLLHYIKTASTLPTAFQNGNNIHVLNSLVDLVALGIDGKSGDETTATFTSALTKGATGDTIAPVFTDPITGVKTTLCTYAQVSGDSTNTIFAASVATAINANTYATGFSATANTGTLTITPPKGWGVALNGATCITFTVTGSIAAGSLTLGVTGVGSEQDIIYYEVSEFFRIQGLQNGKKQGKLWLGIYNITASPSTYSNFTEVKTMQAYANGQINQIGVYATTSAFATSHVTALQAAATALQALNTPLTIIYQPDISGTSSVGSLSALRALSSPNVAVTIGQDGANVGNKLYKALGKSVGCLGVTLGSVALAPVQESILWRAKYNVVDTLEYTTLAWANGTLLSASGSALPALIDTVSDLGYIFLRNETTPQSSALFGGVFFNVDATANVATSDFAYIPDIRTINKALVNVRAAILPALGGTLYFNADGTLTDDTLAYLTHLGDSVIGESGSMTTAGEISIGETIIDPTQNVQTSQNLQVTIKIVQAGVARQITINLGYTASL